MARYRKQATPEQAAVLFEKVASNLDNIGPIMRKHAKRYQATMRRNVRTGVNANKTRMAPLKPITMSGRITNRDGSAGPARKSYGNTPLNATGEMVRKFIARADKSGWVAYVNDDHKRKVSFWQGNVPTGQPLRIRPRRDGSGKSMAKAMRAKGMMVTAEKARTGFVREARLPFGLSSRQVKRSVTDLNKFVLKPLLS